MKLCLLVESDIVRRAKRAYTNPSRGGLFGIADEFGCDLRTAGKYAKLIDGGTYGEHDIIDKMLHRLKSPQCIYKLLKYFGTPATITKKLLDFYIKNFKITKSHRPSPSDNESLKQLKNGERLVSLIPYSSSPGLVAKRVPWLDGIYYVART